MQKKLIALALASLAGSAFAQSNVTIYGVADATYDYVGARQSSGTKIGYDGRVSTNSSLLGFKGTEDLGNGLKAVFQFEGGFGFDAGASATAWGSTRDSFVGLSSGVGTVVLGNLTLASRALGNKVDINAGATGVGYQGSLFGETKGTKTNVDERTANSVAYISPNFSGLSGMVAWGAGSENRDAVNGASTAVAPFTCTPAGSTITTTYTTAKAAADACAANRVDNVWSAGLNYENGPIYAGYAFHKIDNGNARDVRSNRVAGYFKFANNSQVGLLWDRTETASVDRRDAYQVNGKLGLGAGAVIASYGKARDVQGAGDTGATQYVLGYEHSLSKRTILKAVYSEIKNDSAAKYNFYINPVTGATALSNGADPRALQVGIRHSF